MSDDEDFYASEGEKADTEQEQPEAAQEPDPKPIQEDEDLEEGEEEDEGDEEGSDSDIDIITERKDGSKPAPAPQSKYNNIRDIPQRNTSGDAPAKSAAVKKESKDKATPTVSGADLPGVSTSKIDVNAKPVYEPAGKRITQVNIDEGKFSDLNENEKPWRRPGTDVSDYFNYGFDEFTWALYASKQETIRSEFNQDKIAQNQKKMFEDMNLMVMGGMPGMSGMPGMPAGAGGAMPSMEGITPEMQSAMMQMMGSGMDPSQMDPAAMFAAMQGGANAGGGGGAQGGNQGQGFGGQGGFGQGQGQQMDYGYGQGQGGNNRGGNFGRGRGGRRNW
ncbi:Pre-mRNA polyadenylation factor FIP1 [Lachnellula cervina]|uniref:Pre-mRNA polyadenylation factor FIP1 n=1 Tax=Lachnellula cervina TaxID=1316786 RepID=A0A7D8YKP9_9HELO|nr:Pre-mRNA polyadenylation factor FIP1 [Lachnellula cervina]